MKRFMLSTIFVLILITIVTICICCRNKKIVSVDNVFQKKLGLNIPFKIDPESNVEITAIEVNGTRQCLIQIKNLLTGETKSGWIGEGEFVSFAPKEVGTSGFQLHTISEKSVILNFRHGYTK